MTIPMGRWFGAQIRAPSSMTWPCTSKLGTFLGREGMGSCRWQTQTTDDQTRMIYAALDRGNAL